VGVDDLGKLDMMKQEVDRRLEAISSLRSDAQELGITIEAGGGTKLGG